MTVIFRSDCRGMKAETDQLRGCYEFQVRDNGGLDQGGSSGSGNKASDSRCIFKIELTVF